MCCPPDAGVFYNRRRTFGRSGRCGSPSREVPTSGSKLRCIEQEVCFLEDEVRRLECAVRDALFCEWGANIEVKCSLNAFSDKLTCVRRDLECALDCYNPCLDPCEVELIHCLLERVDCLEVLVSDLCGRLQDQCSSNCSCRTQNPWRQPCETYASRGCSPCDSSFCSPLQSRNCNPCASNPCEPRGWSPCQPNRISRCDTTDYNPCDTRRGCERSACNSCEPFCNPCEPHCRPYEPLCSPYERRRSCSPTRYYDSRRYGSCRPSNPCSSMTRRPGSYPCMDGRGTCNPSRSPRIACGADYAFPRGRNCADNCFRLSDCPTNSVIPMGVMLMKL